MRPRSVTTSASRARRFALTVLVIGAAVMLAACGSSGSSSKAKSTPTTAKPQTSSTSGTSGTAAVVVKTAKDPTLGTILVDADGKTLYTLTNAGAAVPCTGPCLTAWPPLLVAMGTTSAAGGDGVTGLATVPATGGNQVTQAGLPLYHFAADTAAGDAKGEGLSSFGGTWHVVKIGGSAGGSASTTTTTNSSGY